MAIYRTIQQGEHLSSIAHKYGFIDYNIIWNDPQNAALKKKRENPNVLYPGDQLYIPDKKTRQEAGATEQQHVFQLKKSKLELRLVLQDLYERPIANTTCELHIENQVFQLTTDRQGKIEQAIPATAQQAFLVIKDPEAVLNKKDPETALIETVIPIKIGHLDPVEEESGQKSRLNNLGYFIGAPNENDKDLFRSAVEEFQCDHGLKVDGVCGPITQAKLKEVHGC